MPTDRVLPPPAARIRLQARQLSLTDPDYLHYRYLWPHIEKAVRLARHAAGGSRLRVLDVGCGDRPYADLFEGCEYIGFDVDAVGSRPHVVCDVTALPVRDGSADVIVSTQVIEHVPEPQGLVSECYRALRAPGVLILTAPFFWPLHEEPNDFQRFTIFGLESLLRSAGFKRWDVRPDGGDWARFFLSINLYLLRTWHAPVRVVLNVVGAALDAAQPRFRLPANYTVVAFR